jgi:WS/DGAT/MGAT family acyltransferase
VFLALVAGAVRQYLLAHGELPEEPLTVAAPVSVRRPGEERAWGNRLATWIVGLATDLDDPLARLAAIHHGTEVARAIQTSHDRKLQDDWMEYWPAFRVYSAWLPAIGNRLTGRPSYSLIASSVAGPRQPLYRGGARLEQIISMGPLLQPFGLNITGWSYVDDLTVGVVACREHVPDIWDLAEGLPRALDELETALSR